jgi:hypothetical protein
MRQGAVAGDRILIESSDRLAVLLFAASQSAWPRSISAAVVG